MILPAITWSRSLVCTLPAHTHSNDCYENGILVCTMDEHTHTYACFDAPPALEPDYYCGHISHVHNENCYSFDGVLCCTLTEHVHTDICSVKGLYTYDVDPLPGIIRIIGTHNSSYSDFTKSYESPEVIEIPSAYDNTVISDSSDASENGSVSGDELSTEENCFAVSEDYGYSENTVISECTEELQTEETESVENVQWREYETPYSYSAQPPVFALFGGFNGFGEEPPVSGNHIILEVPYIKDAGTSLDYSTDTGSSKTWHPVTDAPADGIPGSAQLRLTLAFGGLTYEQLRAADYTLEYELPAAFRDAQVNEKIRSGDDFVGTLKVEDGKVVLLINSAWAATQSVTYSHRLRIA